MINRAAIILRPKQPYIDWAASLDDSDIVPQPDDDKTVYLAPVYESDEEADALIKHGWPALFEAELQHWHLIEADWPANRTLTMFKEWFEIEMHSMLMDLCEGPLLDDEL